MFMKIQNTGLDDLKISQIQTVQATLVIRGLRIQHDMPQFKFNQILKFIHQLFISIK